MLYGVTGPAGAETYGNPGHWGWAAFGTEIGIGLGKERTASLMGSWSVDYFQTSALAYGNWK